MGRDSKGRGRETPWMGLQEAAAENSSAFWLHPDGGEAGAELGPGSREGAVSGARGSLPQAPAGGSAQLSRRRDGGHQTLPLPLCLSTVSSLPSEPPGARSPSWNLPEALSWCGPPWPCRPAPVAQLLRKVTGQSCCASCPHAVTPLGNAGGAPRPL